MIVELDPVIVKLLFNVTAPLKIGLKFLPLLAILNVPLLPEATVIGLAKVNDASPINVAFALPLVSPMVMTFEVAPKALALVWPATVPAFIVKPPVKVFAPDKVNCEAALFWITPNTLVPMIALIVTAAVPLPEFVMVPLLLTDAVERVIVPVLVSFNVIFPVPVIPPLKVGP